MVFKNISVCFVWRGGGLVVLEVVEVSVVVLDGGPFRLRRLRKPEIDENRFLQIFLSDRSIYLFFFWFQGVVGGPNYVPGRRQGQGTIDRLRHPTISTGTSVVVKYIYKATSIGAFCLVSFFSPKDVATKYILLYRYYVQM